MPQSDDLFDPAPTTDSSNAKPGSSDSGISPTAPSEAPKPSPKGTRVRIRAAFRWMRQKATRPNGSFLWTKLAVWVFPILCLLAVVLASVKIPQPKISFSGISDFVLLRVSELNQPLNLTISDLAVDGADIETPGNALRSGPKNGGHSNLFSISVFRLQHNTQVAIKHAQGEGRYDMYISPCPTGLDIISPNQTSVSGLRKPLKEGPQPLHLKCRGAGLTLLFSVVGPPLEIGQQIKVSGISFDDDEPAVGAAPLTTHALAEGHLMFQQVPNAQIDFHRGNELKLSGADIVLHSLVLQPAGISLTLSGTVRDAESVTGESRRTLKPSCFEGLKSVPSIQAFSAVTTFLAALGLLEVIKERRK